MEILLDVHIILLVFKKYNFKNSNLKYVLDNSMKTLLDLFL